MTVKDNRPLAHTENHTEAINQDIEAHIDHQDRTTSHDNNHNNNLTHNNKQLNNNIPSINIHSFTKNLNVLDVDNMDTIREDVV
jgi:hypothetical protein